MSAFTIFKDLAQHSVQIINLAHSHVVILPDNLHSGTPFFHNLFKITPRLRTCIYLQTSLRHIQHTISVQTFPTVNITKFMHRSYIQRTGSLRMNLP